MAKNVEAKAFQGHEALGHPENQIVAIVDDSGRLNEIVHEFSDKGFMPQEIGLLRGREDATRLDAATGKEGFFSKLATMGISMGDRDVDYLDQYRIALLDGHGVIAVVSNNDQTRSEVRQILKKNGCRGITYFGQFTVEVLEG